MKWADAMLRDRAPEASDDVRLLRRVHLAEGPTGDGDPDAPNVGVAIDVETTGLDPRNDVVTELAMRRFRYDDGGRITMIGRPWTWLEDPARPLSPEVVHLTGLTDEMLEGQEIDEVAATRLLSSADLVIAHNASFDRPRVEARLENAAGLCWACSCAEIDWRRHGFDGRSLGHLLVQAGMFNGAHRAADDVDSLIALLRHEVAPGRTALAELVERSFQDGWIVRAVGAAFDLKDQLRARGYRWDPDAKAWWREVAERTPEEWWLISNVYAASASPRALGPEWERVSNRRRWA